MNREFVELVRDTTRFIHECIQEPFFSTKQLCDAFACDIFDNTPQQCVTKKQVSFPEQKHSFSFKERDAQDRKKSMDSEQKLPLSKKAAEVPSRPPTTLSSGFGSIRSFLKNAHVALSDTIADDTEATRVMHAWQEQVGDYALLILSCDGDESTQTLIKNLCKSADQKLGKTKIVAVEELQSEEHWNSFLEKNRPKLFIATEGFMGCRPAMPFFIQSGSSRFLKGRPLIILSSPESYIPKEKIALWNKICSHLS